MRCFVLLTVLVFASKNESDADERVAGNSEENSAQNTPILVKIEEDEYVKRQSSTYIGVSYSNARSIWEVTRWSKTEKKLFHNGTYKDEKTAAHASDTLARKLMTNDRQSLKLNFPDDDTEVHLEITKYSKYIGVSYHEKGKRWAAQRWSKNEKKTVNNGIYRDEKTAAHASDTLARKLMANGEQGHKLNFPDDNIEVHVKAESSKYFGVSYKEKARRWYATRWSKTEKKLFYYGAYKDEKTAAQASDSVARKLTKIDGQDRKLNFPDDETEVYPEQQLNKRKRSFDFEHSQTDANNLEKFEEKEK